MIAYRAACFGKLPLMADFIRHNAIGPEVNLLDQWLAEGIVNAQEKLGDEGWKQAYTTAGPRRFMFRQGGGKAFTVGVMVPGRDKPGRLFPFMVFTTVDARAVRKQPALLPLLFGDFLDRAELFATGGWQNLAEGDSQAIHASVEALSGEVDNKEAARRLDAGLKSRTAGDLWSSVLGGPQDDRRYILLMNMRTLLDARSKPRFALQVPPPANPDDLAVWLTAANDLRGLDGFPELTVWNQLDGLRMLLVPPTGDHYRSLFLAVSDPESSCALADEGLESAEMLARARKAYGALGDDPGLTLANLIYKLRRTSLS